MGQATFLNFVSQMFYDFPLFYKFDNTRHEYGKLLLQ